MEDVSSGTVVECTDGLLKIEAVAKSVELIVIVDVSSIGFRLDRVSFSDVVGLKT